MSSSVSYINAKHDYGTTTEYSELEHTNSFDIPNLTENIPLGTGNSPISGIKRDVDYSTDKKLSSSMTLDQIIEKVNNSLNIPNGNETVKKAFIKTSKYYNRFKIPDLNLALSKGFGHVFFVRPNCNIFSDTNCKNLRDGLKANEMFYYTWKKCPDVVKELVRQNGHKNDFMLSLSNAATGFALTDEYINSDKYGKTYTGYKISYGKNDIESKTAGTIDIPINDDRDLHMYQLIRLWVEYISGVYRGEISPADANISNKILDYAGACYYILTAEDNETIIFWSKYYGIFPTQIPSTQYEWRSGETLGPNDIKLRLSFNYSFKEDYNPYSLIEFNYNAKCGEYGADYMPVYDKKLNHTGQTWVGTPFIELIKDEEIDSYMYKLRFRKSN